MRGLARIDRATLLYVAVALTLTLARWPGVPPASAVAILLIIGLLAGWIAPGARKAGVVGAVLAEFYPLLLAPAIYTEVGLVNAAVGVAHDELVQGWERAVFSGQPALEWIRSRPSPLLSSLMHAGYLAYYFILPGGPAGLWLVGRREAARETLFLIMATFYFCYTVFLLFPVAGPRYLFPLPQSAATATPIAAFTHRLVAGGSAWGTAFPSSHVAVAFVAAFSTARSWRALGAVLVAFSILLALGTVYGQFHYGVDALAGAAVAALALALSRRRAALLAPGRLQGYDP